MTGGYIMNQKKQKLLQKINQYICPVLLASAVFYAVTDVFSKDYSIICTIVFAVSAWLLFGFFDILKNIKRIGGLIYTIIFFVLMAFSSVLLRIGASRLGNFKSFLKWFFGDLEESNQPLFFIALVIGGGFFLISILYYFTQIRYRSLGVMLCTLFPFVIYTKRYVIMPEMTVTIIVVLYLAVIVHNRHIDPSRQETHTFLKIDRSYVIVIAIFVSVTGTVTMMIPKSTYSSLLETYSSVLSYDDTIGGKGTGNSDTTSEKSSSRYGDRNYTGQILFTFDSGGEENTYYLRKQPYDRFNGDVWEKDMNNINRYYYTDRYPEYEIKDLVKDFYKIYVRDNLTLPDIKRNHAFVEGENFSATYLPCPLGTSGSDITSGYYRKHLDGRVERTNNTDQNLHDAFSFYEQDRNLYEYAGQIGLNTDEYSTFLENNYYSENVQRIYSDFAIAQQLYSDTDNISSRIARLADEITQTYHSDIEKAYALERYFEENGYVYDESYVPEDTSIDYFIFEGKTGICTNYATAMTLMARSVGLTARYTEGFVAFEKDENGNFVIRDSYAHAFVEVYIPAVGWMTFDPTVSGYMTVPEQTHNYLDDIIQFLSHFTVIIVVAVCIIVFVLRERFAEIFFRIAQLFRSPEQRTLKLYEHIIKLVNFSTGKNYSSYTVSMLEEYLLSSRHTAPKKLFALFEKTAFGGYSPNIAEYREAYKQYKKCYRSIRKLPKK